MDVYAVYYLSLGLQALISLSLCGWLWVKAGHQPGMKPLALFCLGTSLWGAGQLAINLGDDAVAGFGRLLLNLGPINPVFFLHFVTRFTGRYQPTTLRLWYAAALLILAGVAWLGMGNLEPWLEFRRYYVFRGWGWVPATFVVSASLWAHILLLLEWRAADARRRRQMLAIAVAGIWGSLSTVMFLNPSLGWDIFPYSVILLPGYAVLLVYGILRYDLMAVNHWANRVLVWLALWLGAWLVASLLIGFAVRVGFGGLAAVPLWQLWLLSAAMLGVMLALEGPSRQAMERLIFPGAHLDGALLARWRVQLEQAEDWPALQQTAEQLLQSHLRQAIVVAIDPGADLPRQPAVVCRRQNQGRHRRCELLGWEGATPGVRRVGEVFAELLAAAAARLDQLLQYAEHEKQRLRQAHLLELGGLAAAVAHELRNPLNIINMAAVSCPADTRADIREQIERSDRLIRDLLTYAGNIELQLSRNTLLDVVRRALAVLPADINIELAVAESAQVWADPLRLEQVLHNLLGNAAAMLRGRPAACIRIESETASGLLRLRVCDNGPGIPADMRNDLFQPFRSRRPGGTGLGLAIVRRLVEAHGGSVRLIDVPEWACCFQLELPEHDHPVHA